VDAKIRKDEWVASFDKLDRMLPSLDDAHAIVMLQRSVAVFGDAHTTIDLFGRGGWYPITFEWFDDGIYVVGSDDASIVGQKLVAVGKLKIDEVVERVGSIVPHENAMSDRSLVPVRLADANILAGLDIAASYELADGRTIKPAVGKSTPGYAKSAPAAWQGPRGAHFWNKPIGKLVFVGYETCADDPNLPMAKFAAGTMAYIDQNKIEKVVVDLRRNGGGDSTVIEPLVAGLAARPNVRVYAIIGAHTFSSGVLAAIELREKLKATLVGQATSGKPNSCGDHKSFALPRSKLNVYYSTKRFAFSKYPKESLEPDRRVADRAADWFAGKDAALEAIVADP
jgi:hypothetical protein